MQSKDVDFGSCASKAFNILRSQSVVYGVLYLTLFGLTIISIKLNSSLMPMKPQINSSSEDLDIFFVQLPTVLGLGAINFLFFSLIMVFAILLANEKSNPSSNADLGLLMTRSLTKVIPYMIFNLIFAILIGFGFLFFIVPGIIIVAGFFLMDTSLILSKNSWDNHFQNSWKLMDGHKVKIILLLVAAIFLFTIYSFAIAFTMPKSQNIEYLNGAINSFMYIYVSIFKVCLYKEMSANILTLE